MGKLKNILKAIATAFPDVTVSAIDRTSVGDRSITKILFKRLEPKVEIECSLNLDEEGQISYTTNPGTPTTGRFSSKEANESNGPKLKHQCLVCSEYAKAGTEYCSEECSDKDIYIPKNCSVPTCLKIASAGDKFCSSYCSEQYDRYIEWCEKEKTSTADKHQDECYLYNCSDKSISHSRYCFDHEFNIKPRKKEPVKKEKKLKRDWKYSLCHNPKCTNKRMKNKPYLFCSSECDDTTNGDENILCNEKGCTNIRYHQDYYCDMCVNPNGGKSFLPDFIKIRPNCSYVDCKNIPHPSNKLCTLHRLENKNIMDKLRSNPCIKNVYCIKPNDHIDDCEIYNA